MDERETLRCFVESSHLLSVSIVTTNKPHATLLYHVLICVVRFDVRDIRLLESKLLSTHKAFATSSGFAHCKCLHVSKSSCQHGPFALIHGSPFGRAWSPQGVSTNLCQWEVWDKTCCATSTNEHFFTFSFPTSCASFFPAFPSFPVAHVPSIIK